MIYVMLAVALVYFVFFFLWLLFSEWGIVVTAHIAKNEYPKTTVHIVWSWRDLYWHARTVCFLDKPKDVVYVWAWMPLSSCNTNFSSTFKWSKDGR